MNPDPATTKKLKQSAGLQDIASRFVEARRAATPLVQFPGSIPDDLEQAYLIQDLAIDLWGMPVGGWKVGRIPVAIEDRFGIDRLCGPIFTPSIHMANSGECVDMPIYAGGFAAIEAEFVAVIERDAPADKLTWSVDEAKAMIADLRIGIEIASSPLATINELGPTVVISDFGNNNGLLAGPSINNWRSRPLESMRCSSSVNQQVVGSGGAFNLTGGVVRSVQFLLELTASRGRPLRAGDLVATGQTTGIHDVEAGQLGGAEFGEDGGLGVRLIAAKPAS